MKTVVSIENVSKYYRLGLIGRRTFFDDLKRWWAGLRGRSTSLLKVDEANRDNHDANYIWALRDVTFQVQQGEVLGIIGHNGAGKSTLLKILSRVTATTSGLVKVKGRVASLLEVGTGFHPELTGRENIYLNGAILGMSRAEVSRKLDEIVDFSGVEKYIDTPVKRYSSGMYVRLAFAVAAHLEPEILIVDEVLAVGDAEFQKKCLRKMGDVAGSGRTILFVSHNMNAITSLCERAIWLDRGMLKLDASAQECVSRYLASTYKRQTSSDGWVSLDDHMGRRKNFDEVARLSACQLVGEDRKPTSRFLSGRSARILIKYTMKAAGNGAPITFVCAIKNGQGRRIAYCSSDIVGSDFTGIPASGVVECVIPALPLLPGMYFLDIGCKVAGGWADFIYEAVEFEVADRGFYPTKLLPPNGEVLLKYDWNVIAP